MLDFLPHVQHLQGPDTCELSCQLNVTRNMKGDKTMGKWKKTWEAGIFWDAEFEFAAIMVLATLKSLHVNFFLQGCGKQCLEDSVAAQERHGPAVPDVLDQTSCEASTKDHAAEDIMIDEENQQ